MPSDVDGRSSALLTHFFLLVRDGQVQMGRNRVVFAGMRRFVCITSMSQVGGQT